MLTFQSAAGTLDVSDLARVYARETGVAGGSAVDVENTPRIALGLRWPATELAIEYAPRLQWVDVFGPDSPLSLLHGAAARASWRWRRASLWLAQTASIGEQNFGRLSVDGASIEPDPAIDDGAMAPPELELVPRATVIDVAAAETSAGVRYDLSRRWRGALEAAFGISGGADTEARRFLPRQRVASADASLDHRLTRRDELGTELGAAQIHTSNGHDHLLISLTETWSTRLTPESGAELGAGAARQDSEGPEGTSATRWVPIATAGVFRELAVGIAQLRIQADAGYLPEVNALTGSLQRRLSASAQAELTLRRSSARLVLGAAQTFPRDAPDSAELVSAELALEHALVDWLGAQLGGQLLWQRTGDGPAVAVDDARWVLYAGLLARLPEARF